MLFLGLYCRPVPQATFNGLSFVEWPHILVQPTGNRSLFVEELGFMLNSTVEVIRVPFPVIFLHFVEDSEDRF
jgi:hypothetical protein